MLRDRWVQRTFAGGRGGASEVWKRLGSACCEAAMLQYQRGDTDLTLGEGLVEYYASHANLLRGRGLSDEAREFFRCHDAAHVLFGCSTSLMDEAIVKIWSFFGTSAGLRLMKNYRLPESQEVYAELEWLEVARTALRSVIVLPRVLLRCRRMRKRWHWTDFEAYASTRLVELRREFGIELLCVETLASARD